MSNLYYTITSSPAAQSRGASAVVRNEYLLIQTGFDTLGQQFGGVPGAILVTGVDGGVVNAYTLMPSTAITSYAAKTLYIISPTIQNTGAVTYNVSGLGVKSLNSVAGSALVAGDLVVGVRYLMIDNGADFRLLNVTKNYIDQLVFSSSSFPAQTALTAGKFAQSQGASGVVLWASAPVIDYLLIAQGII